MSVRHGLLALLAEQPRHGYELRAEFERRTGGALNVGQVYTTLARLERDGRVAEVDGGVPGQNTYALTEAGRQELAEWFATPVRRESRPRDELAIKLALAVDAVDVDVRAVLQAQRTDSLRALQDYTRLKARADEDRDLAWLLVLDALVFQTEAEVRWLDHCESRLVRARLRGGSAPAPAVVPTEDSEALR
jgi:DNA-binding PadR family transcriptional regulator